jgi:23S rRNA (uracil1939-C5)-methyltransferase
MTSPSAIAPELLDLDVRSIAAGGDGVGRAGGMVVFVPRTAPGDRAQVRIQSAKQRFARGRLQGLVEPSSQRVQPPCPHYVADDCGGCQLQHLQYQAQLTAKGGIIRDALQRIARRTVDVPEVEASERQWRYRTKLTLAARRVGGDWIIGLHSYDDPVAVFQLRDCLITGERVIAVWREVMAAASNLPDAAELRISVRIVNGGAAIVIEGGRTWPAVDTFFAAVPGAVAVWWQAEGRARQLIAERAAAPAAASFGQINEGVAERLRAHVVERARNYEPSTLVDAYSGTGDTAVVLAGMGVRVTAIELDQEAAARCVSRLPPGARVLNGRVEDQLPRVLPADVVLLNPPRGGLHERVTATLERAPRPPRAIVYVSCNPATLARDLARLGRYRLMSVRGFDMFPQTAHVETVCELAPETA